MQTETSTLPVVHLNVHKTFNRTSKPDSKNSIVESRKTSPCRNTLLLSNKKSLNPLPGQPYRNSMKQQSDESKSGNKNILKQRVMSAKMLRFKQLQNQLADAHYHLNELANENRLLKALQKRQDSALRRYEGTNAELPRIINSHHEELRVLQTKYKKLKELHKDTCNLLKEKETELHSVNSQNKHLLQLSKDKNLGEREKLQLQISDMNHKIQQQQETIQLLHRKLALETKSLKHQLHVEISKHRDTQKNLQETIEKLKNLECLLDNKKKRLYYNGQLPVYNKEKNLASHSLTNLRDMSVPNPVKISSRNKKYENDTSKDSLPLLDILESNDNEKIIAQATDNVKFDHQMDELKSETMANLQQIRKFRLQKSSYMRKNAHSMDDLRLKDPEVKDHNKEITLYRNTLMGFKETSKENGLNNDRNNKLKKMIDKMRNQNSQKLQKELKVEFDYSSDDVESGNASEHNIEYYSTDTAQKSRELYARLISSTDDTSDTIDNTLDNLKRANIHYSDDEEEKEIEEKEEEFNRRITKNIAFQKHKCKNKSRILRHRNNDFYDDAYEVDSIEKIAMNGDYCPTEDKPDNFQTNLSNYGKNQFSKSIKNDIQREYNTSTMKESYINSESKNTKLHRMPSSIIDDVHVENIENGQQTPKKRWLEEQYPLKNDKINKSFADIDKESYIKEEQMEYKTDYASCSKMYHNTSKQDNIFDENLSSSEKKEERLQQDNAKHEILPNIIPVKSEGTDLCKINENGKEIIDKKSIVKDSNKDYHSMHNIIEEVPKTEEISNVTYPNGEEILNENNLKHCIETKNKLNTSLEAKDVNTSFDKTYTSQKTEQNSDTKDEITKIKETNNKKKVINYNKEKLLATMKAIDDNENIEFLNQGFGNHNIMNRMQITENLFRGLPTHSKPKRDVIKDIFEDNIENKTRGTCSKSH